MVRPRTLPLKKTLEDFGATVRWDAYAGLWTIQRNSVTVRVKPRAATALVNGQPVKLPVPLVMKNGQPYVSEDFINTVFAPSLDKTFQIESYRIRSIRSAPMRSMPRWTS
jgi:primary-amine oxidase